MCQWPQTQAETLTPSLDRLPGVMERSGRRASPAVALLAELLAADLTFACMPRPGNDGLCFLHPPQP